MNRVLRCLGVPEAHQVVEIWMDTWVPLQREKQPLEAVPAPESLQAEWPLLVARTRDERVSVMHASVRGKRHGQPDGSALDAQPLDRTQCGCLKLALCVGGGL
jgi:hypothetical protein